MSAQQPEINTCDALVRQRQDLADQLSAAVRRQHDLEQQLQKTSGDLARLGLMQIGKKMMIRAEQDNIRKKLTANKQLQKSLAARMNALDAQLEQAMQAAEEAAALAEAPAAPVEESVPTEEPIPEAVTAPVVAPVAPVEEPAPKKAPARRPAAPQKPRTAAPRMSSPRRPKEDWSALALPEQAERLLARLEPYYPEHQVFALEVLPMELRERLSAIAAASGFDAPGAFLQAKGWQLITAREARVLRQGKYCTPGEEPEIIRPRLNGVLRRMEKHYPDRVIGRSIQHDHKSLAQDASALHQWLGYPSVGAMLTAYGFRYDVSAGGRPATDADGLLAALRSAYAEAEKPQTIAQIMADHPEMAAALKTLQNQAPRRFCMSLRQYLKQEGVL